MFEARSEATGRIRVVDYRNERRLVVGGDILSVYPLDGDWSRVDGEYWSRALTRVPPRPAVLLIGLGGGTQVHLLRRLARPRLITVIERDPVIVRVACEWFGLGALGRLVINRHRRGDAHRLATALRPRFREMQLRRVRREGENVLIHCIDPRAPGA